MARFSVGTPAANSVDIGEPVATLWNPHGTIALQVVGVHLTHNVSATFAGELIRVSTRGTVGSTTTPDSDNHWGRRAAPVSGAVLDRGNYTVNPTFAAAGLARFTLGGPSGSAVDLWFPEPIVVPGGTGLAIRVTVSAPTAVSTAFTWEE